MAAHNAATGNILLLAYSVLHPWIHESTPNMIVVRHCATALHPCANDQTSLNFTAPHTTHLRFIVLELKRPVFKT